MHQILFEPCSNFSIVLLDGLKLVLLIAWNEVKKKTEDYYKSLLDQSQELAIYQIFIESNLDSTNNNDDENGSQLNDLFSF